jgi:hypothetical protein
MAGSARPGSASWRPILLLLLVAPLLLGLFALVRSGGGRSADPGVDWSAYPPEVHDAIDRAAKNASCAGLAEQRAWATSHASGQMDTRPLVRYIDVIRQQLVCPG